MAASPLPASTAQVTYADAPSKAAYTAVMSGETSDVAVEQDGYTLTSSGELILHSEDGLYRWMEYAGNTDGVTERVKKITMLGDDGSIYEFDGFYDYPALEEIDFGDQMSNVYAYQVSDCPKLTKLRFGTSFSYIDCSFERCAQLKEIVIDSANVTYFDASGADLDLHITVPEEAEQEYKTGYLSKFADWINREDGETYYALTVNGEVFSNKKTTIQCGSGTASFDASTATLTLENAEITNARKASAGEQVTGNAAIDSRLPVLNIELIGTNTMKWNGASDTANSVTTADELNIYGDGELIMFAQEGDSEYSYQSAYPARIEYRGKLDIKDAHITGAAESDDFGDEHRILVIESSIDEYSETEAVTNISGAALTNAEIDLHDGDITSSQLTDCGVYGHRSGVNINSTSMYGGSVFTFSEDTAIYITGSVLKNVELSASYASEVVLTNSDISLTGTMYTDNSSCTLTIDGGTFYVPDNNSYIGAVELDMENITLMGVEVLSGAWNKANTGILVAAADAVNELIDDSTGVIVRTFMDGELRVNRITDRSTRMSADSILSANHNGKQLYELYDIYMEADGERLEPEGFVQVKIPADYDPTMVCLLHIKQNGDSTSYSIDDVTSSMENGYVAFSATEFGYYIAGVDDYIDLGTDSDESSSTDSDTQPDTDSDDAGVSSVTYSYPEYGITVTVYGEDREYKATLTPRQSSEYPNSLIMDVTSDRKQIYKAFNFSLTDDEGRSVIPSERVKLTIDCEYSGASLLNYQPDLQDPGRTAYFVKEETTAQNDGQIVCFTNDVSKLKDFAVVVPLGSFNADNYAYKVIFHLGPGNDKWLDGYTNYVNDAETWTHGDAWKERGWNKTYKYTEILENENGYGFPYDANVFFPEPELEGAEFLGWYISQSVVNGETGEYIETRTKKIDDKVDYGDYASTIELFGDSEHRSPNGNHILDLYAVYKYENADGKLILNANGGKIYGEDSAVLEWIPVYDSGSLCFYDAFVPEREGYNFTGWNTKADGTGVTLRSGMMQNFYSSDWGEGAYGDKDGKLTLYAQWEKRVFTITLTSHANYFGFTSPGMNIPPNKSYTVTFDEVNSGTYTLELPEPQGLPGDVEFLGWYYKVNPSGAWAHDVFTKLDKVTSDDLLYRIDGDKLYLESVFKYKGYNEDDPKLDENDRPVCQCEWWIDLDANGGTIDGAEQQRYTIFSTMSDVMLPLTIPEFTPEREGFKFLGWNTEKDGSGETVTSGRIGPYYAQWRDESKLIHRVDLTLDTKSIKAGDVPTFGVTVPEGSHYKIDPSFNRLYWYEVDRDNVISDAYKFACSNESQYKEDYGDDYAQDEEFLAHVIKQFENSRYRFSVGWLFPDDGYLFDGDVEVYINNRPAIVSEYAPENISFYDSEVTLDFTEEYRVLLSCGSGETIDGVSYSYFEPKEIQLDFKSDDDEIDISALAGKAEYRYYTFLGWRQPDKDGYYTKLKKSDFVDSKTMRLVPDFDMINLPSGLDKLYIEIVYGQGTTDKLELTPNAMSGYEYDLTVPKSEFKGFDIPDPVIDGAEFLGWYSHNGETGEYKKIPSSITPDNFHELSGGADVLQLKAAYMMTAGDDQTTHCLTLDANGGTIYGKETARVSPMTLTSGDTQIVDCFVPEKDGAVFKGWNTEKDGTGEYIHDTGSGNFPIFRSPEFGGYGDENYNVTLYAQWADGEPEPTGKVGDLDGDGMVTSGDALAVLRMSAAGEVPTDDVLPLADVDGDGSVTSADALQILRYSAGLSANESIDKPI